MSKFNLLTQTDRNPKLAKGTARGYLSFVLHLAPARLSGFNVCPMATQGCIAACLNTAGRGGIATTRPVIENGEAFANTIQAARVRRTRLYFNDRPAFLSLLVADIRKAIGVAHKAGMVPVFRLNGTSDIRWERVAVTVSGAEYPSIMAAFPDVQFYDYTKIANRRDVPANYDLTFSLAENNDALALAALANGLNVAAVFGTRKGEPLPAEYLGRPVFNGDETDLRFLDPRGVVVGLYAKGRAKSDTSGFVRR